MFRRRATSKSRTNERSVTVKNGDDDDIDRKLHKPSKNSKAFSSISTSSSIIIKNPLLVYFSVCAFLLIRSYADGITAAGNETWYPVPLIGYVRSELALLVSILGSTPFLILVLGWTHVGIIILAGLAVYIPHLLMPGPIPVPAQAYGCFGIILTFLTMIVFPFWRKPQAAIVIFLAIAVIMPNLPDVVKPLFSSVPVEQIPYQVINLKPDIIEEVGAAALESGPLLDFVWENRNDWVKVSHGRALGYFVFGKNFNHDQNKKNGPLYSLRSGFRLTSYRETWGESDYRLHFAEKRAEVSKMFRDRFGKSLAVIYARVLDIDPEIIVLGDMGALANMENMGFPAVKIVFPSLFWHWFNNPHTDSYLYQMDTINGDICDKKRQRTFLIPLTEPPGAGLYYWFKNGTRVDVNYKVGNVYSFEVSVLHAIRPFPYYEWSRGHMMDSRITIQAFGIPCGNKWYITH